MYSCSWIRPVRAEGFAAAAFAISEKARARSLLESLQEARADIRQGVDVALLERERLLQQTLYGKTARHAQILGTAPMLLKRKLSQRK